MLGIAANDDPIINAEDIEISFLFTLTGFSSFIVLGRDFLTVKQLKTCAAVQL